MELAQLINQALACRGWRPVDLIRASGYRNISSGLRSLKSLMASGQPHPFLSPLLPGVLGIPAEELEAAASATRTRLEAEAEEAARASFSPYLVAITEHNVPTQITFAVLSGMAMRRVLYVPAELAARPLEEQLEPLAEMMVAHFRENQGAIKFFGAILGYTYRHHYGESLAECVTFDTEGRPAAGLEAADGQGKIFIR